MNKRLTDAEVVAEYWAAHGEANAVMTGNPKLRFSRRAALLRFATLPHYDEEPGQPPNAFADSLDEAAQAGWDAVIEYSEQTQTIPHAGFLYGWLRERAKELRKK